MAKPFLKQEVRLNVGVLTGVGVALVLVGFYVDWRNREAARLSVEQAYAHGINAGATAALEARGIYPEQADAQR